MHVFYINLEARADRRDFMERGLARVGLAAERLAGVAPGSIPAGLLAAHCDERRPAWITPAELGAALSHRRAWSTVLERGLPGALVLEDDVLLSHRLPGALPSLAGALAEVDLLRIETRRRRYVLRRAARRLPDGLALHPPRSFEWGSAGYLVSRAGAERLLAAPGPFVLPVDNLMFDPRSPLFGALRVLQCAPALVMPCDAAPDGCWESDIQAGRRMRIRRQWTQRQQARRAGGPRPTRPDPDLGEPWLRRAWRRLVAGERPTVVPFAGPCTEDLP